MNYMAQVAKMLGVELEEEFYLKGNDHKHKFSKYGFFRCFESNNWVFSWDLCEILTGKLEIIKEPKPILDETEKRYLSNVIKPFMALPSYINGAMYKGMELGKQYSLEDLGL